MKSSNAINKRPSDNGSGIPKEIVSKIFDPFFSTKEPGKGTGLGLSIVYGIVNNIHGKVLVQSTENVGTTFIIYFPATETKKQKEKSDYRINRIGEGKSVLIVDDEKPARERLRRLQWRIDQERRLARTPLAAWTSFIRSPTSPTKPSASSWPVHERPYRTRSRSAYCCRISSALSLSL